MKIGIDASRYSHEQATGVESYSWHIINGLLKLVGDDEVVLYGREPGVICGREIKVLKARRFWTLTALSREMRVSPPDVLFVPSHTLPLRLAKRSVITIHDVAFKHLRSAYSFVQYHYLDRSTRYAVKHADKIIVPSMATAEDLKHFYRCPESKIEVIPHGFSEPAGVGDDIFEKSEVLKYFKLNKDSKYFLFVGRLETKKNLVRLIEAFGDFVRRHGDYRLVLAGKRGVGFEKVLAKVDELGLMDKVVMPGYIDEQEKAVLYKYCRAFVFPSLYEGFGLPLLEAFYYRKPILCSNVSSLPEVGGDAVVYADPLSVEDIGRGLEQLMNEELAQNLMEKGSQRLKDFSWEIAAGRTMDVLRG